MPRSERIVSSGDVCPSDKALRAACERSRTVEYDVDTARLKVFRGTDPAVALEEFLEGGPIGRRAQENLVDCLSNIAAGTCISIAGLAELHSN